MCLTVNNAIAYHAVVWFDRVKRFIIEVSEQFNSLVFDVIKPLFVPDEEAK
jgi:hypothetical protein